MKPISEHVSPALTREDGVLNNAQPSFRLPLSRSYVDGARALGTERDRLQVTSSQYKRSLHRSDLILYQTLLCCRTDHAVFTTSTLWCTTRTLLFTRLLRTLAYKVLCNALSLGTEQGSTIQIPTSSSSPSPQKTDSQLSVLPYVRFSFLYSSEDIMKFISPTSVALAVAFSGSVAQGLTIPGSDGALVARGGDGGYGGGGECYNPCYDQCYEPCGGSGKYNKRGGDGGCKKKYYAKRGGDGGKECYPKHHKCHGKKYDKRGGDEGECQPKCYGKKYDKRGGDGGCYGKKYDKRGGDEGKQDEGKKGAGANYNADVGYNKQNADKNQLDHKKQDAVKDKAYNKNKDIDLDYDKDKENVEHHHDADEKHDHNDKNKNNAINAGSVFGKLGLGKRGGDEGGKGGSGNFANKFGAFNNEKNNKDKNAKHTDDDYAKNKDKEHLKLKVGDQENAKDKEAAQNEADRLKNQKAKDENLKAKENLHARGGDESGGFGGAFDNDADFNNKDNKLNDANNKKNKAVKDKEYNKDKVLELHNNKDKENAKKNHDKNVLNQNDEKVKSNKFNQDSDFGDGFGKGFNKRGGDDFGDIGSFDNNADIFDNNKDKKNKQQSNEKNNEAFNKDKENNDIKIKDQENVKDKAAEQAAADKKKKAKDQDQKLKQDSFFGNDGFGGKGFEKRGGDESDGLDLGSFDFDLEGLQGLGLEDELGSELGGYNRA
ncbi:hypothetical protein CONPUDRAFT_169001 [Coniophora puteana RWD-64-598 SS2]|uniref:Uncharacterized protein n=1 Tax=Coniophora puteana (strain RWD-64-598) TaxID=741705 RepID=A0A5M3MB75_CONPW|nr:uncharacterized protein CONPUDRAFT_169001 [Coniophora puteana RWD-64-598 SS2]EIW76472.1 hypothetical protein CONPUDRAFT_169001 [Coniophora puteana RWD-64-598 SS2]